MQLIDLLSIIPSNNTIIITVNNAEVIKTINKDLTETKYNQNIVDSVSSSNSVTRIALK